MTNKTFTSNLRQLWIVTIEQYILTLVQSQPRTLITNYWYWHYGLWISYLWLLIFVWIYIETSFILFQARSKGHVFILRMIWKANHTQKYILCFWPTLSLSVLLFPFLPNMVIRDMFDIIPILWCEAEESLSQQKGRDQLLCKILQGTWRRRSRRRRYVFYLYNNITTYANYLSAWMNWFW